MPMATQKSYERPLSAAGFLWALPDTLVGAGLALLSASSWQFVDGLALCYGDRGLAHFLLKRRGFAAMTLGRVVVAVEPLQRAVWMHEMQHARQAEQWGIGYIPAYLINQLRTGYANNPFELDAVRVEREFVAERPQDKDKPVGAQRV